MSAPNQLIDIARIHSALEFALSRANHGIVKGEKSYEALLMQLMDDVRAATGQSKASKRAIPGALREQFDRVARLVCEHYGITVTDLTCRERTRALSEPRYVAIWLMHNSTSATWHQLADLFNRDHSTGIYGVKWVRDNRLSLARKMLKEVSA